MKTLRVILALVLVMIPVVLPTFAVTEGEFIAVMQEFVREKDITVTNGVLNSSDAILSMYFKGQEDKNTGHTKMINLLVSGGTKTVVLYCKPSEMDSIVSKVYELTSNEESRERMRRAIASVDLSADIEFGAEKTNFLVPLIRNFIGMVAWIVIVMIPIRYALGFLYVSHAGEQIHTANANYRESTQRSRDSGHRAADPKGNKYGIIRKFFFFLIPNSAFRAKTESAPDSNLILSYIKKSAPDLVAAGVGLTMLSTSMHMKLIFWVMDATVALINYMISFFG